MTAAPPTGDVILPGDNILLKLPSGIQKILRIGPDTTISLGKFGSFPSNALLHRPYNLTFDVLDPPAVGLRVVPSSEVNSDLLGGGPAEGADESHYDLPYTADSASPSDPSTPAADPSTTMRTNRHTVDTPASQTLSWDEIEALKKSGNNSGRDVIAKLLASHTAIDQKTPFSLQKYTLRKTSKFLRRFSVQRVDVAALVDFLPTVKEPYRFLELKNPHIALMLSLGNVTFGGRYLVVDETGGLLVAAVTERVGLLGGAEMDSTSNKNDADVPAPSTNTITLIHANEQPNLSHLLNLSYDANTPPATHPLTSHLRTLTWLQLLSPETDTALIEPALPSTSELATLKTGKRTAAVRKHKRWQRLTQTVTETAQGGFDGLLVAAHMAAPGILKALVPLVRGSGQVVVFSPTLQPAAEVVDLYSSARKAAWILGREERTTTDDNEDDLEKPNPTLLLAPTLHKTAARTYQVLPGRTHPVMTSKGGAEGFVFHATRVIPVEGRVDARGAFRSMKKRRVVNEAGAEGTEVEMGQ